jgi:pyruvate dehydrogenase E1 component
MNGYCEVALRDFDPPVRAVPDQIAPFVPGAWVSLGTDGFGRSDTRPALRRHFRVDPQSIVLRVLEQLVASGELDASVLSKAIERYRLESVEVASPSNREALWQ